MRAEFNHSVQLIKEKCMGCTDCIKRCPTEAIRVRNGKAEILEALCIDCGLCIKVCRHHAKTAVTSPLAEIQKYKVKIALPAPSLYGQFKNVTDVNVILTAIKKLGFDDVFEVSMAAEAVSDETKKYLAENSHKKPVISSACPVITRLISMRFPSLLENILPLISPTEAAAKAAKNYYETKGYRREEIGTFFITPCAAKATNVKNPIGLDKSEVTGAISILDLYLPIRNAISDLGKIENLSASSSRGRNWPVSGGECGAGNMENCINVDGIENVIKVLEGIEDGQIKGVDYVEALSCISGCVGGSLTLVLGFVAKNYLKRLENAETKNPAAKREMDIDWSQIDYGFKKEISQASVMSLDSDVEQAFHKLTQIDEIYSTLPLIDCGSCGAPTCRALAEDIVRGEAHVEDCLFMLRRKVRKLAQNMVDLSSKIPETLKDNKWGGYHDN